MFKDIDLSRDIMNSFRQSRDSRDGRMGDVDLNVFVLTTGYWPTYQPCNAHLPLEVSLGHRQRLRPGPAEVGVGPWGFHLWGYTQGCRGPSVQGVLEVLRYYGLWWVHRTPPLGSPLGG